MQFGLVKRSEAAERVSRKRNAGKFCALPHEHGNRCSRCKHTERKPPNILLYKFGTVLSFFVSGGGVAVVV